MVSKLQLQVAVDVSGAEKLTGFGSKLSSIGGNLTKFVTLPLAGAGAAALKLAGDAEKADAKLANVFDSMGASAFTSLEALNAQADALGQLSSFDDEGIKQAQAVMLTFGNVTGDSFDRSIQAVTDMSELLGTDLQSSAIQVGKALNDPVKGLTALSRVGVSFTAEQQEMIKTLTESGDVIGAQEIILSELERQFGGTAEAIANTDAGAAAQSMEDLTNAMEDVGAIVLPILGDLARFLSGLARGFQELDPNVQRFIVIAAGIVAAVGPVIFIAGKLISTFQAVGTAFRVLSALFMTNPFVLLAAAVIAIAALIILNWDKIWGFLKGIWDKITGALGTFAKFFGDTWESLTRITEQVWNGIGDIIKGAINGLIDIINGFFGFLNGLSFGAGPWDIGPIHVDAISIDPFNIGLIPHLASGGIVDSPTLALLGEGGREAVIPLDKLDKLPTSGGHTTILNVEGRVEDPEQLVEMVERAARLDRALSW